MSFTEEELAAAAWRRNLKLAEQLNREGVRGRGPRRTDEWKGVGRRDCYWHEKESQSRWAEQGRGKAKKSRRRTCSDEEEDDVDEFGRMRRTGRDDNTKSKTTKDGVDSRHCRYSERGRSSSRSDSEDQWRRSKSRERREHYSSRSRSRDNERNERYVSSLLCLWRTLFNLIVVPLSFTHNTGILNQWVRTIYGIENNPGLILLHGVIVNLCLRGHMTNLMTLIGSLALHAISQVITDPQALVGNHGPGECTYL